MMTEYTSAPRPDSPRPELSRSELPRSEVRRTELINHHPVGYGGAALRVLWFLLVLGVVLSLPYFAEQVGFAIKRGELRAKHQIATEQLDALRNADVRLATLEDTATAFRLVAQRVEPCVVHIDTTRSAKPAARDLVQDERDFLPRQMEGQGSGLVLSADGYIVTNYHVVRGSDEITVILSDGRAFRKARVIGRDALNDLAVLKIDASGLIAANWGDSDDLQVGDWVLAVGNPYGLDRSVTAGIVSAKERRGVGETLNQLFLQTDAAVNPGNSGGPLVNVLGDVIGINTAIVGKSFNGISFAIPSNVARNICDQLIEKGEVVWGWLGVGLQNLTAETADELGLGQDVNGALVASVVRHSPAEEAGLKKWDLVTSWNGQAIRSPSDLSLAVARSEIDSVGVMTVLRDGAKLRIEARVSSRPNDTTR